MYLLESDEQEYIENTYMYLTLLLYSWSFRSITGIHFLPIQSPQHNIRSDTFYTDFEYHYISNKLHCKIKS